MNDVTNAFSTFLTKVDFTVYLLLSPPLPPFPPPPLVIANKVNNVLRLSIKFNNEVLSWFFLAYWFGGWKLWKREDTWIWDHFKRSTSIPNTTQQMHTNTQTSLGFGNDVAIKWKMDTQNTIKLTLSWWGGLSTKKFWQSPSTRRAQLSVAAITVRSTDLLNCYVKSWVNTD